MLLASRAGAAEALEPDGFAAAVASTSIMDSKPGALIA